MKVYRQTQPLVFINIYGIQRSRMFLAICPARLFIRILSLAHSMVCIWLKKAVSVRQGTVWGRGSIRRQELYRLMMLVLRDWTLLIPSLLPLTAYKDVMSRLATLSLILSGCSIRPAGESPTIVWLSTVAGSSYNCFIMLRQVL